MINEHPNFKSTKLRRGRNGIALVVVLSGLIFLSALILAFLAGVGTELKSSKIYADGSSVRLLAQSAVNIVTAEIREATKSNDTDGNLGTWASQPGMIRAYKNNGQPDRYFKLYSDDNMIESEKNFDSTIAANALSGWYNDTAIFTDLNQPVIINGVANYPILDGNNLKSIAGITGKTYDSDSNNSPDIEGFYINNAPLATSTNANPIPMPVRWLYVLANGEVIAPTGSGNTATVNGADSTNPIVGRMAFWTDDETAKININTASEGTYWDTPRTCSTQDSDLANYQPAQHEYQRYAGHPAMNCLSTVFPAPSGYTANQWAEEIYKFIPRITGDSLSSLEGTQKGSTTLTPDTDRLYASIDELLFKPTLISGNRIENASSINKLKLEQAKFFITVSSRASDLNLFSKPRISIWPIFKDVNPARTTPFDRLIAFCSTMNKHIFFFQREDPNSPTNDLPEKATITGLGRNRMLLEYLRTLTSQGIPGFSGDFKTKYGTKDRDQILTEIFDYIRSTNLADATLIDAAQQKTFTPFIVPKLPNQSPYVVGSGQVVPIEDTLTGTRGFGRFPVLMGVTLLFVGVSDTVAVTPPQPAPSSASQIAVQAVLIPQLFDPSLGNMGVFSSFYLQISGLDNLKWKGVDNAGMVQPYSNIFSVTSSGKNIGYGSLTQVKLWGDNALGGSWSGMEVAGGDANYPFISVPINMIHPTSTTSPTFEFSGGTITVELHAPNNGTLFQSIEINLPYGTFPVPKMAPSAVAGGGSNVYDFRRLANQSGSSSKLCRLQGRNDNKDTAWIRVEDVVRSVVPAVGDMRVIFPRKTIKTTDTEYNTFFTEHSKYAITTETYAHNLRNGQNTPYYMATGGRLLVTSPTYDQYAAQYTSGATDMNTKWPRDSSVVPDNFTNGVALGKTASATGSDLPGDWDNGFSYFPDGPYINKPDEGDSKYTTSTGTASIPYYNSGYTPITASIFSPNRMMPSAGMFGSLPTAVWANKPWQTLLFRPDPIGHPGLAAPRDHLLLDLFNMPVVEPYAISEPLSTAGRINMNYQIVPFTYINRDTGIRSIFKSEKIIVIPEARAAVYKKDQKANNTTDTYRLAVNADETLLGFQQKFKAMEIYKSATEICDLPLVPVGTTYSNMSTYWNDKRLTGDNSRERPYTTIYPRLTTKSNTYTIHVRVQILKKVKGTDSGTWVEGKDLIAGEYRGSQTVERYVDPNNPNFPDFADPTNTQSIDSFYKFRVVSAKQFAP
jgi:uncharacterized protein (TIGR02600 family)